MNGSETPITRSKHKDKASESCTSLSDLHPSTETVPDEADFLEALEFLNSLTQLKMKDALKEGIYRRIDSLKLIFGHLRRDNERLERERKEILKLASTPRVSAAPSYADVTGNKVPRAKEFKILIEKANPDSTEDTKTLFKNAINPRKLRVGIKTFRGTKSGDLIISSEAEADLNLIKNEIDIKHGNNLRAKTLKKHNPTVIIKNIPQELENDEIVPTITEQNRLQNENIKLKTILTNQHKIKNGETHIKVWKHAVVEMTPKARKMLAGRAFVDMVTCSVEDYHSAPRCYVCSRIGHTKKFCTAVQPTCPLCTGPHSLRECQAEAHKCVNCVRFNNRVDVKRRVDANHPALSTKCPSYKAAIDRIITNTDYD